MQLYNSRIIDNYIKLLAKKYSHVKIDEILKYAEMRPYEVADQSHWFTQEQIDRFYEKAVAETGSPNIAREAGRYAAYPDAMGILRHYILGMLAPGTFFIVAGKTADKLTKSSTYSAKKVKKNEIELIVTPKPGVTEKHFQCENRLGFFEAVLTMFNYDFPSIQHPECMFRGGQSCRYNIRWKPSKSSILSNIRYYGLIFFMIVFFVTIFFDNIFYTGIIALTASFFVLSISLLIEYLKNLELKNGLETLSDTTEKLVDQTNINYRNSLMADEIGMAISGKTSIDDIFNSVTKILNNRLEYNRGLILLSDPERLKLSVKACYGYTPKELKILENASFNLNNKKSKGVFIISYNEKKPVLVNNLSEVARTLSPRSLELAEALGVTSFVCCPIVCEGQSLGVIVLENMRSGRLLLQSDLSQLMGIAPVIGIAIRNAELLEAQENLFKSTLKALAASIDARDPLTAGHSEKVTEYAIGICEELNTDTEYREVVRVAALLHDYGKIGVPDAILKKPGKLTMEEREAVKTHAFKTRDILEQISFEGKFKEVPAIAAAHHEKLDGSGYPMGLRADAIPLGAKIIAVADFFEAITSKRHYREPMPVAAAFQLLRAEAGTHFDKDIVEAFFLWYRRTYAEGLLPEEERRRLRVPFKTSVAISFDGRHHLGHSVDLSTSGAFISTSGNPKEGALVDLAFTLPTNIGRVVARGRVAWINPPTTIKKPTFPAGFGVEFIEFKDQSGSHLLGFLTDTIRSEHVWAT